MEYCSAFDTTSNKIWDALNRGVCFVTATTLLSTFRTNFLQRQWKDIRHNYIQKAEEEDEE
jgi:hypothetical protein